MAKKDQTNGTPIEFQIPSAGGEGPRIPAPTNQPNWIYGYKRNLNAKPVLSDWIAIGVVTTAAIALGTLLIVSSMYRSPLWIAVIIMGAISLFSIYFTFSRIITHKPETENNSGQRTRKKKLPKTRKDYK